MFSKSDVRGLVGWALVAPFAIGLGCIIPAETLPDPTGGSSTVGAGGVGGESGGGGTASSGTAGGSGGNTDTGICGDGIITPPEVCDPEGEDNTGWCSADCLCGTAQEEEGALAYSNGMGGCYIWFDLELTWFEALGYCSNRGLHLASITTMVELDFVNMQVAPMSDTWIGGSDLQTEDKWLWANGEAWLIYPCPDPSPLSCDNNVNLWGAQEPNDTMGEDCAVISVLHGGKFNDLDCDDASLHFLCERTLP